MFFIRGILYYLLMSLSNQNPKTPIFVMRPYVPPLEEYMEQLKEIWGNRWFTNTGPKHAELKKDLAAFLGTPNIALVGNGTFALMAALAAFNFEPGEVITTPYTFVASSHCLKPFNLTPKFVDIEPEGLTIDPDLIEAAITPQTRAILGVHVYGNPCHIEKIDAIAKKHNLKVIYDAAHAFAVTYKGQSIFNYGDASTVSFHATKAFHTFEGGAVFSPDPAICDYVRRYRNFGIEAPNGIINHHGLNTKMSELHAAAGIVNLRHYNTEYEARKKLYKRYQSELKNTKGFEFVSYDSQETANYNYCPVLVKNGRDELAEVFAKEGIYTRKYFYPLLSDMPEFAAYQQHFPVASRVVEEVLCLPIYSDLSVEEQDKVISIFKDFLSKG